MTREEKAKAYDEALEDMRAIYPNLKGDAKLAVEHAFPQLIESEDEKMINELQGFLDSFGADYFGTGAWQKFHDWLEKQKESLHISETCKENPNSFTNEDERIRKELVAFFIEVRNREGNEGYWHDLKVANILAYLEKQKDLDKMIVVSPEVWDNAISDAYENGKKDEEKQKEQKPVEKQDYSGLNDLERVIHRGFLAAGVENVPVTIIKETAKECLTNIKPAEWSEEDEEVMEDLYNFVISDFIQDHIHETRWKPWKTTLERNRQNRLKSLRPVSKEFLQPHWKPSEEQMDALSYAIQVLAPRAAKASEELESLREQLKKL